MSTAAAVQSGFDPRRIAEALAPGTFRFDPLGIVSGYKAYLIYTGLAAKSDKELAAMRLDRRDLPRVAMDAANGLRAA